MLKPITVRSHTGPDGVLSIRVPTELAEADVDVVIVVHPVDEAAEGEGAEALGWPPGFLEKYYGALAGSGLKRHPQGDYEERDPYP